VNIFSQEKNALSVHEHYATQGGVELSLKDQEIFRDRLRSEMRKRKIKKQYEFAKVLGITPTYLSAILGGKRIGSRQMVNFAKRLKVPIGYLLGLEDYQEWWGLQDEYLEVPLVKGRIAANPAGQIPGDAVETRLWLPKAQLHGHRDLVAVRLGEEADSMTPTLRPGDTVVIDRADKEIVPHHLFAVRLPDMESCAVKRVQKVPDKDFLLLLSDNRAYPPEPVPLHDYLIIGRVIWSSTYWVK